MVKKWLVVGCARLEDFPCRPSREGINGGMRTHVTAIILFIAAAFGLQASPPTNGAEIQAKFDPPRGVVKDDQGRAIDGATVVVYCVHSRWGLGNKTIETVTSDAAGNFVLAQPLTFENLSGTDYTDFYLLYAKKAGFAAGWAQIFSNGPAASYELTLMPSKSQLVHVTDRATGQPIKGAAVFLYSAGTPVDHEAHFRRPFFTSTNSGMAEATTDEQGKATISGVPDTTCGFRTTCSGYAPGSPVAAGSRISPVPAAIQLTAAATVSGVLQDDSGAPIADAILAFSPTDPISHYTLAKTASDGTFVVDDLIPKGGFPFANTSGSGDYNVEVRSDRFTAPRRTVHVDPGQWIEGFDITASPGVLIKGKLIDVDGKPVVGGRVQGDSPSGRLDSYSDRAGTFRWRVMPGQLNAFVVSPPGGTYMVDGNRASQQMTLTAATKEIDLTLRIEGKLGRLVSAHGRLLRPEGTPAAGVAVLPSTDERVSTASTYGSFRQAITAADGTFTFDEVPVDLPLQVYADAEKRKLVFSATVPPPALPAGEVAKELDLGELHMIAGQTVTIHVTDLAGKPRGGLSLLMTPETCPQRTRAVRSGADGNVHVDGIIPDLRYSIQDRSGGGRGSFQTTLVPLPKDGGGAAVNLVVDPAIAVHVVGPDAKPILIGDITQISVTIPEGAWQLGPKPQIVGHLDDGSVTVSREQFVLGKPGAHVEIRYTVADGSHGVAVGQMPSDGAGVIELKTMGGSAGVDFTNGPAAAHDEIAARIVDPDGKPLADVEVSLLPQDFRAPRPPSRTNADGVVRFPGIQHDYQRYFQIAKAGFGTRWLVDPPMGKGITVKLDNTTRFRGTLHGVDGSTLTSAATIMLITSRPTVRANYGDVGPLMITVVSDEHGAYDVPIEPGEYEARVTAPAGPGGTAVFLNAQHLQIAAGQVQELPGQLGPGADIKFLAIDETTGKPVAGVKFFIERSSYGRADMQPGSERTSDEQGVVHYESLMPTLTQFEPWLAGYTRWWCDEDAWFRGRAPHGIDAVNLKLAPGAHTYTIHMQRGMHVFGKVITPNGESVDRVWIEIEGLNTGDQRYAPRAKANGEFETWLPVGLRNQPVTTVSLKATDQQRGWTATSEQFQCTVGGERSVTLKLAAEGSGPATQP